MKIEIISGEKGFDREPPTSYNTMVKIDDRKILCKEVFFSCKTGEIANWGFYLKEDSLFKKFLFYLKKTFRLKRLRI